MNGLPPSARRRSTRREQRISGGANGSLSMTTSDSALPGTSTPSQKLALPSSTALPSSRKRTSSSERRPSPWTSNGNASPSRAQMRQQTLARLRQRAHVVNSRNARPPLAFSGGGTVIPRRRCGPACSGGGSRAGRRAGPCSDSRRDCPTHRWRGLEPELRRVMGEIAADGQRGRCENPRARAAFHLAPHQGCDRQRRRLQQEAVRRDIDPADPFLRLVRGIRNRRCAVAPARDLPRRLVGTPCDGCGSRRARRSGTALSRADRAPQRVRPALARSPRAP